MGTFVGNKKNFPQQKFNVDKILYNLIYIEKVNKLLLLVQIRINNFIALHWSHTNKY